LKKKTTVLVVVSLSFVAWLLDVITTSYGLSLGIAETRAYHNAFNSFCVDVGITAIISVVSSRIKSPFWAVPSLIFVCFLFSGGVYNLIGFLNMI